MSKGDTIEKVSELKEEILTMMQTEDKRYDVDIARRVLYNWGFTTEEFASAYNALVMELKINGNDEEMWLLK